MGMKPIKQMVNKEINYSLALDKKIILRTNKSGKLEYVALLYAWGYFLSVFPHYTLICPRKWYYYIYQNENNVLETSQNENRKKYF